MKRNKASLPRRTRLKTKGRRRITAGNDEAYLAWIRTLPCAVATHGRTWALAPCAGTVEVSHNRSRNLSGDDRDAVPLCANHHRQSSMSWHHAGAWTFQRVAGLDVYEVARQLADQYEQERSG